MKYTSFLPIVRRQPVPVPVVFLLLGLPLWIQGQTFAPNGATWTLGFVDCPFFMPWECHYGNEYVQYTADDTLNGVPCKRLEVTNGHYNTFWVYEEAGKVFYWEDPFLQPDARLLYDFTKQAGEFFIAGYNDTVRIDSVYADTLNGIAVTSFKARVNCGEMLPLTFNNRFGAMDYHPVFPAYRCLLDVLRTFTFRCYTDDVMPLYNVAGIPCDSIITSVQQAPDVSASLQVWPNPVNHSFLFRHNRPSAGWLYVYNMQGTLAGTFRLPPTPEGTVIPADNWAAGLYVLLYRGDDGTAGRVKIYRE